MPIASINASTYEVTLIGGDKVEIGDSSAIDFKPHLKLFRWDGECFLKVSLPTTKQIAPIIDVEKIKWVDQDIEVHFYVLDPTTVIAKDKDDNDVEFAQNELGGFEFEIILPLKPSTNHIVLDIETKGLRFCYQPPLHPDHPTWREDEKGYRQCPDNVVGSFAVYHDTRTPFHKSKADADKYKVGKAFHIYRPKITDAADKWIWGELSLDNQANTLTITIDQSWLDSAIYPVSIDPNFGNEIMGGTGYITQDKLVGTLFDGAVGTGVSISAGVGFQNFTTEAARCGIYLQSDFSFVAGSRTEEKSLAASQAFLTFNCEGTPSLFAVPYVLVLFGNNGQGNFYFDFDVGETSYWKTQTGYPVFPDPWTGYGSTTEIFSIYCTYAAGGGGAGAEGKTAAMAAKMIAGKLI